jgi:hypothetical protein
MPPTVVSRSDGIEQLPKATHGANLIIGAGVQAAAASTAEIYGIPYRYVVYCPSLLPSPEHPPVFLPLPRSTPWLNRRLWNLARIGFNRGMRPALNRHRSAMGLPPVSDLLDHLLSARPVVAADPLLGALPSRCPLPFDQVPCLHPFDVARSPRAFWPTRSLRHSITSSSPSAPNCSAGACARASVRIRPPRSSRTAALPVALLTRVESEKTK